MTMNTGNGLQTAPDATEPSPLDAATLEAQLQDGAPLPVADTTLEAEPNASDTDTAAVYVHNSVELLALASKVRALESQLTRSTVDATIDIGTLVYQARQRLDNEEFDLWVAHLGPTRRTVYRYLGLYKLARQRPDLVQDWKGLGITKFYMLDEAPASAWDPILSSYPREKILAMSAAQFHAIVAPHIPHRETATISPGKKGHGLAMQLRSMYRNIDDVLAFAATKGVAGMEEKIRPDLDLLYAKLKALEVALRGERA